MIENSYVMLIDALDNILINTYTWIYIDKYFQNMYWSYLVRGQGLHFLLKTKCIIIVVRSKVKDYVN